MYVGPGHQVQVRCQNTQGGRAETLIAERQRAASASARGDAFVSTIQESGRAPVGYPWAPVAGFPNLQQATLPGRGRRGDVFVLHQTPPPGPSGTVPTRNGQMIFSSRPITNAFEVRSLAVPATQRAALAIQTDHGTFGSQHAVSGVPALSAVQTRDHWTQLSAMTPPGQLLNLSGDFNHGRVASVAAAALVLPPVAHVPHVRRAVGATHQGGSGLDGFWTSSAAGSAATQTTGMTGDHLGQQMMDVTY